MSDSDLSDSQVLKRFPGFDWMPRWTRRYWTPSMAAAIAFFIFSGGIFWGTWYTVSRFSVMESHVQDLWEWKKKADFEGEKPRDIEKFMPKKSAPKTANPPVREKRKAHESAKVKDHQ